MLEEGVLKTSGGGWRVKLLLNGATGDARKKLGKKKPEKPVKWGGRGGRGVESGERGEAKHSKGRSGQRMNNLVKASQKGQRMGPERWRGRDKREWLLGGARL